MKTKNIAQGAKLRQKTGILDHIEIIVEITKNEGLESGNLRLNKHASFVAKKLGITNLQAILFSLFMEKNAESSITMEDIAKTINCNNIKILKYANEFEALEKKKLIRCSRNRNSVSYRVPYEVCESLRKNNSYQPKVMENLCIDALFVRLSDLFDERQNNELAFDTLNMELVDLFSQNKHLLFCKNILRWKRDTENFVLFSLFCHLFANNDDDDIREHDFAFVFDDKYYAKIVSRNLSKGDGDLFDKKLIEHNYENGFKDSESLKLTDKAKKEYLSELKIGDNNSFAKELMPYEKIKLKRMYYNPKETESVWSLTDLLREENYQKVIKRLDSKGLRKGFACLFSGPPGTGKTETVYQIARETKRHIMVVDISSIKNCWYGETEKQVKKVFDNYREAVENSKIAPILLFNEADAIIGKRKELSSSSRAIDQVENTIQNIILQEMENLNGILIATTNLVKNMDSAFERRFLYKIEFSKPSFEGRHEIWKSMLPDIPETHIKDLASKYDLSGGQIENIARKVEVDAILKGEHLWIQSLSNYCDDEVHGSFDNTEKRIGFNV